MTGVSNHYRIQNIESRVIMYRTIFLLQLPTENTIFNDTHSRLRYIPEEETDFGLVYCWARNSMGIMRNPCVFQLIPAGKFFYLSFKKMIFMTIFVSKEKTDIIIQIPCKIGKTYNYI